MRVLACGLMGSRPPELVRKVLGVVEMFWRSMRELASLRGKSRETVTSFQLEALALRV